MRHRFDGAESEALEENDWKGALMTAKGRRTRKAIIIALAVAIGTLLSMATAFAGEDLAQTEGTTAFAGEAGSTGILAETNGGAAAGNGAAGGLLAAELTAGEVPRCGDLEHVVEVTPYRAPTCTEFGIEQGMRCSVCGLWIAKPYPIPPLRHRYGEWTKLDDLQHQRVCSRDETHVQKEDHRWE